MAEKDETKTSFIIDQGTYCKKQCHLDYRMNEQSISGTLIKYSNAGQVGT